MAKLRTIFSCQKCGTQAPKWLGRCPDCGAWGSLVEEAVGSDNINAKPALAGIVSQSSPVKLPDISQDTGRHQAVGIAEFDRVMGGGIVPGSLSLIGGDPGIGKSTLILQIFGAMAKTEQPLLYISGEESAPQIKQRAERLGVNASQIYVITENCLEKVLEEVKKLKPAVIAVDSIQTIYSNSITSSPGTVSQIREATGQFMLLSKATGIATLLVGHVTKDGAIAGPKTLEHMVDTVLYFEGERGHPFRLLRTVKNRFGSTNEIGVFEMTGLGLQEVANPSSLFLAERPINHPGSVVVSSLEGSRPVLVEIQALVSPSGLANPRRTALGVDANRLSLLVAVLDKIIGVQLHDQDIFVNVAGGMKVAEPAIDLGLVCAVHSSVMNKPLDPHLLLVGEVGLTGEVRAVSALDVRMNEAHKMGFTRMIVPRSQAKLKAPKGMEVVGVANVNEALQLLY
ncbi:MAG: DNA repair protein RadA [Deltaproteobacteria bacterium CG11_big_fil_rev_8_21_14_0_20_47_16]|nr:MAG: DNA repair protein RadA [Deltaproteobacteria bacterium CG11_big_fil_rev_8_21_14_0_20_47_16]